MMFNYLVSALSTSATLVLFDGSPLHDPALLWEMASDLSITVFGTVRAFRSSSGSSALTVPFQSAKYLDVLAKGYSPKAHHSLPALKQVLSTGSPLKPELFSWVYEHIKSDVLLGSITGGSSLLRKLRDPLMKSAGTDICSLFGAHNAALPVYEGEIQCIGLGMAVESWSEEAVRVPDGEAGGAFFFCR